MPGQELVDTVDGVIGDVGKHMAQPGLGIDAIELGRADQRVNGGGPFTAGVGAGDQVIAPSDGDATQREEGQVRKMDTDRTVRMVASPEMVELVSVFGPAPPARVGIHSAGTVKRATGRRSEQYT